MRVAVIGLGAMGSRIAHRLLASGHQVNVWNRTPERADPLRDAGATVGDTPADAVREVEVVVTMLADPPALFGVISAPDGVAGALRPGQIVAEMSTVGPAAIHRLGELLPPGVALIDAPVLGSISEAEAGDLQVFAGGPADVVEAVWPLFEALGTPVHVGAVGSGAGAKLVANATLLGTLTLLGEVVGLAEGLGLPRDVAFDVLSLSPLAAQAERRRPVVEGDPIPVRFRLALAVKDADLVSAAARDVGLDAAGFAATARWFRRALDAGDGEFDYSTVVGRIARSRDAGDT